MVANTMTFIYDTYAYLYNARSELTNAVKNVTLNEYAYQYDDIGNRLSSLDLGTNRTYTANVLNQYTQITSLAASASLREEFIQQFDADGNQTLIQTATGVWSVTYSGENRPVSWTCGATNLTMRFDSMGRRAEYLETTADEDLIITNKHQYFVYDGYLCLQIVNAQTGVAEYAFEWDPTEPVATRPMVMQRTGNWNLFYTHDMRPRRRRRVARGSGATEPRSGRKRPRNKNVSELVYYQRARGVAAHYEYAPFGAVTVQTRGDGWGTLDFSSLNPFRFSSEFADDALGLVYYNYRHYEPVTGRWLQRDSIMRTAPYRYVSNYPADADILGQAAFRWGDGNSQNPDIINLAFPQYLDVVPEVSLSEEPYRSMLIADLSAIAALIREMRGISNEEYLTHCPCCIQDARREDGWSAPVKTGHEGGDMEVRREFPNGAKTFGRNQGQQCVYDVCGRLINTGRAAGTPDDYSYRATDGFWENLLHGMADAKGYAIGLFLDKVVKMVAASNDLDLRTRLDHLFNPPDMGMDVHGDPCPLNDGRYGVK